MPMFSVVAKILFVALIIEAITKTPLIFFAGDSPHSRSNPIT
jgi:hypothetical protein